MFKSLIVGNWKMHGTAETAVNLASQLAEQWAADGSVEMILFPRSFTFPQWLMQLLVVMSVLAHRMYLSIQSVLTPVRSLQRCFWTRAANMHW